MANNPTLEAALAWAAQGYAVFPCVRDGKEPACTNGVNDATIDETQIRQWWSDDPAYNLAVAPDSANSWILDSDPPLGADTLASLELEHGLLPVTLTFQTPRGGTHYWFKGTAPSTVQKLGPKLDTRGQGGYVLVPPSIVQGKPYVRLIDAAIAESPGWFATLLARSRDGLIASGIDLDLPNNVARARDVLAGYVRDSDVAVEGQGGDDRTYRTACTVLSLGLTPERAYQLISEVWNPHCIPPWDEDELAVKIRNAADYMQNELGAWAVEPPEKTFEAFRGEPERVAATNSRFRPLSLNETDAFKEPTWIIPGLIPEAGTVQITGKQKSFKTFLALDIACGIASGTETFGHTPTPRSVVYIAGENASAIALKHVPAWKLARLVEGEMPFYIVPAMPRAIEPGEVQEVINQIRGADISPAVVVIDTATRALRGLDENSSRDMGLFSAACEHIQRELGCTVVVIRHTGKDTTRGGRGSNVIEGDFDTILDVERHVVGVTKTMFVALWVKEQRNAAEREAPYAFEGFTCGPSLAFNPITEAAWNKATRPDDMLAPAKIGAALVSLNAMGEARGVATAVLAAQVVPQVQSDTPDARMKALAKAEKALKILARGKLSGYATGEGTGLKWSLPSAEIENDSAV